MRGEAAAHFLYLQVQLVAQLILVGGKRRGGVDHQAALDDLIGKGLQLLIHREHETGIFRDPRRVLVFDDVLAVAPNGRPADIVEHGGEPLVGVLKVSQSGPGELALIDAIGLAEHGSHESLDQAGLAARRLAVDDGERREPKDIPLVARQRAHVAHEGREVEPRPEDEVVPLEPLDSHAAFERTLVVAEELHQQGCVLLGGGKVGL